MVMILMSEIICTERICRTEEILACRYRASNAIRCHSDDVRRAGHELCWKDLIGTPVLVIPSSYRCLGDMRQKVIVWAAERSKMQISQSKGGYVIMVSRSAVGLLYLVA